MVILARKFERQRHKLDDHPITDIYSIDANFNCCCGLGTKLNHIFCSDLNDQDITKRDQLRRLQTMKTNI
jgi:hypothetical protein